MARFYGTLTGEKAELWDHPGDELWIAHFQNLKSYQVCWENQNLDLCLLRQYF